MYVYMLGDMVDMCLFVYIYVLTKIYRNANIYLCTDMHECVYACIYVSVDT